jgi:hypothetical protein
VVAVVVVVGIGWYPNEKSKNCYCYIDKAALDEVGEEKDECLILKWLEGETLCQGTSFSHAINDKDNKTDELCEKRCRDKPDITSIGYYPDIHGKGRCKFFKGDKKMINAPQDYPRQKDAKCMKLKE